MALSTTMEHKLKHAFLKAEVDAAGSQSTLLSSSALDFGWTAENITGIGPGKCNSKTGSNGDPYLDCQRYLKETGLKLTVFPM